MPERRAILAEDRAILGEREFRPQAVGPHLPEAEQEEVGERGEEQSGEDQQRRRKQPEACWDRLHACPARICSSPARQLRMTGSPTLRSGRVPPSRDSAMSSCPQGARMTNRKWLPK